MIGTALSYAIAWVDQTWRARRDAADVPTGDAGNAGLVGPTREHDDTPQQGEQSDNGGRSWRQVASK